MIKLFSPTGSQNFRIEYNTAEGNGANPGGYSAGGNYVIWHHPNEGSGDYATRTGSGIIQYNEIDGMVGDGLNVGGGTVYRNRIRRGGYGSGAHFDCIECIQTSAALTISENYLHGTTVLEPVTRSNAAIKLYNEQNGNYDFDINIPTMCLRVALTRS